MSTLSQDFIMSGTQNDNRSLTAPNTTLQHDLDEIRSVLKIIEGTPLWDTPPTKSISQLIADGSNYDLQLTSIQNLLNGVTTIPNLSLLNPVIQVQNPSLVEGGELLLKGVAPNPDWYIDVINNTLRLRAQGAGQGIVVTPTNQVSANNFTTSAGTSAGGTLHNVLTNNSVNRWGIGLGGVESTGNQGSSFNLWSYADNGSFLRNNFTINRTTGEANFSDRVRVGGGMLQLAKNGITSAIIFDPQANDPGFIEHEENNNVATMRFSASDDTNQTDGFEWLNSSSGFPRAMRLNTNGRLHVVGNSGLGASQWVPTISLSIGDVDTGFNWGGDGIINFVGNGRELAGYNPTQFIIYAGTSFINNSDERLKEEIEPLSYGLDFVEKLQPRQYRFKEGDKSIRFGFIAQEVKELISNETNHYPYDLALWNETPDEQATQSLSYLELIAVLVKSVQELSARVKNLETV